MIFLEDFSHVMMNILDETTINIEYNHSINSFLLVTPSSVSLMTMSEKDPKISSTFECKSKIFDDDILISGAFINKSSITCLTSKGRIFLFQIDSKLRINFTKEITIKENTYFSTISTYNGFVVACDHKGFFRLLSTESVSADNYCLSLNFELSQWPIKKLSLGQKRGIILCADGSTMSFEIDKTILSNSEYKLKPKVLTESGVSLICGSPKSRFFVEYMPSGVLHITDLVNFDQKITNCPQLFNLAFSDDGQTVFGSTRDGFIAWSSRCQRIRYLSSKDTVNSRSLCLSDSFLVSSINYGIAIIPLLKSPMNRSPLLFGDGKIIEARAATNGCLALVHPCKSVGNILSCSSDESGRLISVVGTTGISLFAKSTANWHTPEISANYVPRDVDFMDRMLCLTAYSKKDMRYVLLLAKSTISQQLEIVKSFPLTGRPISLRATLQSCAVVAGKSVFIVDGLFNISKMTLKEEILVAEPISPSSVILLTKNFKLMKISSDEETLLLDKVTSFFVDSVNRLVFAQSEFAMFASQISNINFVKIFQSEDIPIGILSDLFALVTIEPGSTLPLHPVLTHFFNPSLIDEEKSAEIISRSPFAQSILMQIATQSVRSGHPENSIPFLMRFKDHFPTIITAILRTSEPPEREKIFGVVGRPTKLFTETAKCTIEDESAPIPNFVPCSDLTDESLQNGALLLEVVFAGDGVPTALSAAIFLAEHASVVSDDFVRAFRMFVAAAKEMHEKEANLQDLIQKAEQLIEKLSNKR